MEETSDLAHDDTATSPRPKKAHHWPKDPLDFYVEEQWCSEALFRAEHFEGAICDPAVGIGRVLTAAHRYRMDHPDHTFGNLLGYDIVKRSGWCYAEEDFLVSDYQVDNIVSNPPFGRCAPPDFEWIKTTLLTAVNKVALLLPLAWVAGAKKGGFLTKTPLETVHILTPRPSMPPGELIVKGMRPGGGTVDYAWFVWNNSKKTDAGPTLKWLNRDAA